MIAGPCVVESEELVMEVADKVSGICRELGIPYVFKASYRKANRTSAGSFTGIGDEAALALVKKAGQTYHLPTTSDIHAHDEAAPAAKYVDILQIPAFLCRQTDLLVAAAEAGDFDEWPALERGLWLDAAIRALGSGAVDGFLNIRGGNVGGFHWIKDVAAAIVETDDQV